jgi:CubicO group peptidase (beta-lactamase class C family)
MNHAFLGCLDEYIHEHRYRLINAVLVYENDELIFERYYNKFTPESRHQIKSVWKSIVSLTLGICLDKGIIRSIDDVVCRYLPFFNEDRHPYHKRLTIKHLLTMSSGIYWNGGVHYHCPMFEQLRRSRNWAEHIADVQMKALPGSVFQYKEWDVILLSAIIGTACGSSVWDFCNRYLYQPLGIKSDRWTRTKCSIDYPSYGEDRTSDLSARDLAKIGLLMLHGGKWNGQQIISEEYAKAAISPSAADGGYGFLWWLSAKGYHGRGFGGQELNIYPDENSVAVVLATVTPSSKSYGDICENII